MQTAAAIANEKKANEKQSKEAKKKKKKKKQEHKIKEHEDDCFRCGWGGELVMCDRGNCPKVYHLQCLNLQRPPTGILLLISIGNHFFITKKQNRSERI